MGKMVLGFQVQEISIFKEELKEYID